MIWPGAKRPPPIASELERRAVALEEGREERCEGAMGCEDARRGVFGGAIVSPSGTSKLASTNVTWLLESTGSPHVGQYRLASGTSLEQEAQRINSGDCIIVAELPGLPDYLAASISTFACGIAPPAPTLTRLACRPR
jgi:hypothetical protein